MKRCSLGRPIILSVSLILFLLLGSFGGALADNAVVLPKGLWQIFNETAFFLPTEDIYDDNGDKVPFDAPFNTNLTPLLPPLPPNPFLMQPANVGSSVVNIELGQTETQFTPAFGITDRFSIGIIIPYLVQSSNVQATVNSSMATTGLNPLIASPTNPLGIGFPCFALGCSGAMDMAVGTSPLNINDVNELLALNGFQPLATWKEEGFGDIQAGGRYQYYRAEHFRAAFTGGVQFPTGKVDDPDNLVDRGFGTGAFALLFQFQQDLLFQGPGLGGRLGFPNPGDFFVNTDFRYALFLPDSETVRVCPVSQPICPNKATLDRDLGDKIEARLSTTVGLLKGFIVTPEYRFLYLTKTDFSSGTTGLPVQFIEDNTISEQHEVKIVANFTTIPWVVEGKFPVPLVVAFTWRDRFAGRNSFDTEFFGFNFTIYGK